MWDRQCKPIPSEGLNPDACPFKYPGDNDARDEGNTHIGCRKGDTGYVELGFSISPFSIFPNYSN